MNDGGRRRLGSVVLGLLALGVLALVGWGIVRRSSRKRVQVAIYLGESTQGLAVGSAVRLRGITLGEVRSIRIASDGRLIEVESALWWDRLVELGLADPAQPFGPGHGPFAPPGFYAYLAPVGFTDLRTIELDFFAEDRVLEFPPPPGAPWAHIPGVQSTSQAIKEFVETTFARSGPGLLRGIETITELDEQTRDLDGQALHARLSARLDELEEAFAGPSLVEKLAGSIRTGREGLELLRAEVAAVQSALSAKRPGEARERVDELLERLARADPGAQAAALREGLQDQERTVTELREQTTALRAALREARDWLDSLRDDASAVAGDRDGLLSAPRPAESPPR
ncbi:MAG: MCE family protein [Planctomycetes bacterium]|nr:MCE family protein [Planctomycetota bacterium]